MNQLSYEDYLKFLSKCNSFNRLPTLLETVGLCSNPSDWIRAMGSEWTTCDNIADYRGDLEDALYLLGIEPGGTCWDFMTVDEAEFLKSLPDKLEVWRGCYIENKWGLSWSLDHKVAQSFPFLNRYQQNGRPLLVRASIPKNAVFAVKLSRNEFEVICFNRPKHISTRTAIKPTDG